MIKLLQGKRSLVGLCTIFPHLIHQPPQRLGKYVLQARAYRTTIEPAMHQPPAAPPLPDQILLSMREHPQERLKSSNLEHGVLLGRHPAIDPPLNHDILDASHQVPLEPAAAQLPGRHAHYSHLPISLHLLREIDQTARMARRGPYQHQKLLSILLVLLLLIITYQSTKSTLLQDRPRYDNDTHKGYINKSSLNLGGDNRNVRHLPT